MVEILDRVAFAIVSSLAVTIIVGSIILLIDEWVRKDGSDG